MRAAQRRVGTTKGGLIAVEGVMAVALGDVRGGNAAFLAQHLLALTGAGDPQAGGGNDSDQADPIANLADSHLNSRVAQWAVGCGGALPVADCGNRR